MAGKHATAHKAILRLYRDQLITGDEAVLLSTIDWSSLTDSERIASKMGVCSDEVLEMVDRLKAAGILLEDRDKLVTAWNPLGVGGGAIGEVDLDSIASRAYRALRAGPTPSGGPLRGLLRGSQKSKEAEDTEYHPRWRGFASRLAHAISTVRHINLGSRIHRWTEAIRKIHSIDNVSIKRIRLTMRWYCNQIRQGDLIKDNSGLIPIAYSGDAFRRKFLRIESAMKRDNYKRMIAETKRKEQEVPQAGITVIPESEETRQRDREMAPWLYDEDGNPIDLDSDEEE